MGILNYCGCGCAWNPGWFTSCPKCDDGRELEAFDPFALPEGYEPAEHYPSAIAKAVGERPADPIHRRDGDAESVAVNQTQPQEPA